MIPNEGSAAGGARSKGARLTLHVVASIDGLIANKDNTVAWMDSPGDVYEKGVAEGAVDDTAASIDCFVLGSRTYEHALQLGWPYGDTPTIVVTSRKLPSARKSVEFYSGDLTKLVHEFLAPRFGKNPDTNNANIWLVGGAKLCQSLLRLGLVDEIRLVIAPVTLGEGLPLFAGSGAEQKWHLKNVVGYKNGYVELTYRRPPLDQQV
jgi:dihydrofolate reductase